MSQNYSFFSIDFPPQRVDTLESFSLEKLFLQKLSTIKIDVNMGIQI